MTDGQTTLIDDIAGYCCAFLLAIWIAGVAGAAAGEAAVSPVFFTLLIAYVLLEPLISAMRRGAYPLGRGALTCAGWTLVLLAPVAGLLQLGAAAPSGPGFAPLFALPLAFARPILRRIDPASAPDPLAGPGR